MLALKSSSGVRFLAQDTRHMQGMRKVDWGGAMSALAMVIEKPAAERGYEMLKKYYEDSGLTEESSAVGFLIQERFHADSSDPGAE